MPHSQEARANSAVDQEQPHFAEALRQPAGDRNRDGVRHAERGDHPGALRVGRPEVTGNGGDRHVGDGGVQHLHEGRHGERDRHPGKLGAFKRFLWQDGLPRA